MDDLNKEYCKKISGNNYYTQPINITGNIGSLVTHNKLEHVKNFIPMNRQKIIFKFKK